MNPLTTSTTFTEEDLKKIVASPLFEVVSHYTVVSMALTLVAMTTLILLAPRKVGTKGHGRIVIACLVVIFSNLTFAFMDDSVRNHYYSHPDHFNEVLALFPKGAAPTEKDWSSIVSMDEGEYYRFGTGKESFVVFRDGQGWSVVREASDS